MSNLNQSVDTLRLAIEQGQKVQSVEAIVDSDLPKGPVAIKIQFETVSVCVAVCASDDTITLSDHWPREHDGEVTARIGVDEELWRLLAAARLAWGWLMRNHLGYEDGVQLEFMREGQSGLICIQFIAIASTLELRIVKDSCARTGSPSSHAAFR